MLKQDISIALKQAGSSLDPAKLHALIKVESSGGGFDTKTGKIKIAFEPKPFKERTGVDVFGGIDVQSKEWASFNHAFDINPVAAMESTSIGLPQIMGYHWNRLGFESVGAFWDYMKGSLVNQICALIKFIETDNNLLKAFNSGDWHKVAWYYNGSGYANQAHKLGITPYNIQLKEAYEKYVREYQQA